MYQIFKKKDRFFFLVDLFRAKLFLRLCWLAYFPDFSGLKTVDMLALGVATRKNLLVWNACVYCKMICMVDLYYVIYLSPVSSLLKPCQLAVLCTEYSKLAGGADMSYSTLDDIFSLRPPSRMASDDVEYKSYNKQQY